MVFEGRRCALRLLHHRQVELTLFLSLLNTLFDVTNGFGVFVDFDLVLGAELPLERRQLVHHHIQQTLLLPQSRFPSRPIGAATVTKKCLEHRPRVPLHR